MAIFGLGKKKPDLKSETVKPDTVKPDTVKMDGEGEGGRRLEKPPATTQPSRSSAPAVPSVRR